MVASRRARLMAAWLVLTLAALIRLAAEGMLPRRPAGVVAPHAIDPNRASIPELCALPGIGLERAQAIVLHRVRHGPFRAPADLALVHGIGPSRVGDLAAFLAFDRD
jgi:competence ComEA-like helix-hairpin-helix protein